MPLVLTPIRRGKPLQKLPFSFQRGVHITLQCDAHVRVAEELADGLGVQTVFDAARGEGVPERVEGMGR